MHEFVLAMVHTISMSDFWNTKLTDAFWIGFDTETTGIDPKHDQLVSASLITRGTPAQSDIRYWLADPGVEIPASAQSVHGISTEQARRDGLPLPLVLEQIAAAITTGWQRGGVLVAFNLPFDLGLLECNLVRCGMPTLSQRMGGGFGPVVDPLVIDRYLVKKRPGPRKLANLCTAYGLGAYGFHDARDDVNATLDLLERMVASQPTLGDATLGELARGQQQWHAQWAEGFNAFLASKGRTPDVSTSWPL